MNQFFHNFIKDKINFAIFARKNTIFLGDINL